MTLTDVTEAALYLALFVFLTLCVASFLRMLMKRRKGRSWGELMPNPGRFFVFRAGIAVGAGALLFVVIAAALTLNQHRPPEGESPVITVGGSAGRTDVAVDLPDCGEPATGKVRVRGVRSGTVTASIRTESRSSRPIPLNGKGIGRFTIDEATSRNGVLSCYLPLPVVDGGTGTSVTLSLGEDMEVDTLTSVPGPAGYRDGSWIWDFDPGDRTGALASLRMAVEDGARQVIVLVLAAVFGAIIALFIGEVLIEPVRRRLDRLKKD